jgi:hypothetical protein
MRHNPEILTVVPACCAVCAAPAARAQGIAGVRPARVKVEVLGGYSFMRSNTVGSSTRESERRERLGCFFLQGLA